MSGENNMAEKYQQYYNQIIAGTLNDTVLKSISYQANIKLANEIIAEQEKTIQELNVRLDSSEKEKIDSENSKICSLENQIRENLETIKKLNSDISEMTKEKIDFDNAKHQLRHLETFKNELNNARNDNRILSEEIQRLNEVIINLNDEIELLKNPPSKKKKPIKSTISELIVDTEITVDSKEINTLSTSNDF